MKIQWFPGHMAQTLKMIDRELKLCDAIIYVLDARCPVSALNPKFDEFIGRKPVLFVLNKIDLAPDGVKEKFENSAELSALKDKKIVLDIITRNSVKSGGTAVIINRLRKLLAARIETAGKHGINKILRVAVIGVTNCGKSTLINNMNNKGKTKTENRAGVTRTKQWVSVADNLWLLDTPGTLYPVFTNPQIAKNLAYVGSIKDDVLNIAELSAELLDDITKLNGGAVAGRFGAVSFGDIARKRGLIMKGGVIDEMRTARVILTEFRSGKIGKFNLDELL
jgi:ribosome biogenesis GTPase A